MKKYILIIALSLLSLFVNAENKTKRLSATDFYIKMEQCEDKMILDCSTLDSYNKEHLLEAVSIASIEELKKTLKDVDKETSLFIYCKHGDRSKTACKKIKALGFRNIYELKNGLYEWNKQEYPTIKTSKK